MVSSSDGSPLSPASGDVTPGALRSTAEAAAAELLSRLPEWDAPSGMVQLGTGFCDKGLFDRVIGTVPLDVLPGMPSGPSPASHALTLSLCQCGAAQILVCRGRRHAYEGYGPLPCVLPVCAAALCGVRDFLLTSTATGAVHEEFKPGTWMVATDYINNLGLSPLVGNQDLGAEAFPDMTDVFSQELISELVNAADPHGLTFRLGTYQANLGPQLATPAEVSAARRNGADALGRSVVLETIAINAMGGRVTAVSLVLGAAAVCGGGGVSQRRILDEAPFLSSHLMRVFHALFAGRAG